MGWKFGLVKLYFGLRFVCVMLLVTAKLNNNNTEFSGGWVGAGCLILRGPAGITRSKSAESHRK